MRNRSTTSRTKKFGAAAALATLLAGTGVAVAGAAAPHHHAHMGAHHAWNHQGGHRHLRGPGGEVTALSASSVTIQGPFGNAATFSIDSATVFIKAGVSVSASDVSVGSFVRIIPSAPGSNTAAKVLIQGPHVAGKVTAIDGSTLTLTNRQGTTFTVIESGATTYTKDDAAASASDLVVGQRVEARGTFAMGSTTTLNATTINIGIPGAEHGPERGSMPMGDRFGASPPQNN